MLHPADENALGAGRVIIAKIRQELDKVVVGNDQEMEHVKDALCAVIVGGGHVLFLAPTGVAKTVLLDAAGQAIGGNMKRKQFTPDMLPSDLKGFLRFNEKTGEYEILHGPLYGEPDRKTNILLADEINRATPKTQSALLEAMEEGLVTVWTEMFELATFFLVLGSRNPFEQDGVYDLPEAQRDRFFMQLIVRDISDQTGLDILEDSDYWRPAKERIRKRINPVTKPAEILVLREAVFGHVRCDQLIDRYIVALRRAIMNHEAIKKDSDNPRDKGGWLSPRGLIQLKRAATVWAFLQGRDYVLPEDVKKFLIDVLAHRIVVKQNQQREWSGARIVKDVQKLVPEPELG